MTQDIVKTPGKYRTGGEGVVDGNGNAISESNKNSDSTIFVTYMLKMIDLSVTKLI